MTDNGQKIRSDKKENKVKGLLYIIWTRQRG